MLCKPSYLRDNKFMIINRQTDKGRSVSIVSLLMYSKINEAEDFTFKETYLMVKIGEKDDYVKPKN